MELPLDNKNWDGELDNWVLYPSYYDPTSMHIAGEVVVDNKGRFQEGDFIKTSRVISIDFIKRIATTEFSRYYLHENYNRNWG